MGRECKNYLPLLKILLYLPSIICKYRPVSTKLGQNIYVQQNLNEFDHGSNWTEQLELFALELGNSAAFNFVYCLASTNKPISTQLGHNLYEHKISDEIY